MPQVTTRRDIASRLWAFEPRLSDIAKGKR